MSAPVTFAITDHVPLAKRQHYERLVADLHDLFEQQPGFLSADTVRHQRNHVMEYTVLVRWEHEITPQDWRKVPAIAEKLTSIEKITGGAASFAEATGSGLWFDHQQSAAPALPPFWKRVLVSVIAVYPMLMVLILSTAPLIGALPQPLQVFILVVILSALLTWPIMPLVNRALGPWLSKSS